MTKCVDGSIPLRCVPHVCVAVGTASRDIAFTPAIGPDQRQLYQWQMTIQDDETYMIVSSLISHAGQSRALIWKNMPNLF